MFHSVIASKKYNGYLRDLNEEETGYGWNPKHGMQKS